MTATPQKADVLVLSSVGSGVPERLARSISDAGITTDLVADRSATHRRRARGAGGGFGARVVELGWYPIRAVGTLVRRRARAVIATTNPFPLPFLVLLGRPVHRSPVIVLVYDLYPDALEAAGRGVRASVTAVLGAANRFVFRRADHVVFIGDLLGAHARARYGPPTEWSTITTGDVAGGFSDLDGLERLDELESWCGDRVLASYVGHLGAMHDWQTLAGIINGLGRDDGIAVLVAATGSGAEALRSACADVTRDLVRFEAPLGDRDWRAVMARSDVAVVTLRPTAARASSPSKAYSALAAGAAILAVMPEDTDVGTLVESEGCGRRIDPGDADAGLSVLRAWAGDRGGLEAVGAAARQAAQSRDLASLADQWIEVIDRVAPRPRVPC